MAVGALGEGWVGSGSGSGSSVVAGAAGSSSGGLSISHLDHSLTDEEVPYHMLLILQ